MSNTEQKVIGEAAWSLLMRKVDVTISALLGELAHMAEKARDREQLQRITRAHQWLQHHQHAAECDKRSRSPLRTLSQQNNSVRMPQSAKEDE